MELRHFSGDSQNTSTSALKSESELSFSPIFAFRWKDVPPGVVRFDRVTAWPAASPTESCCANVGGGLEGIRIPRIRGEIELHKLSAVIRRCIRSGPAIEGV